MAPSRDCPEDFGLSETEARRRLAADGPNELADPDRRTLAGILLEALTEPMSALLVCGGLLYLVLGDTTEAIVLFLFTTLSIAITVVQEARTERILDRLRDLTAPTALVARDGERRRLPARELVRGDLVFLGEGDRVPADLRLVAARDLSIDESLLTGESVPVAKSILPAGAAPPAEGDPATARAGTLVVRGSGHGHVEATGERSEIGRIGRSLRLLEPEAPRLRAQTRRVVTLFAVGGAAVSLTAVVLYGVLRGNWLEALLSGIALGMSMLPEEFPLVLTVFVAMGAWRISRVRVLARRGDAVEALGATTVLCTDKTGTLTRNRMTIVELRRPPGTPAARLADPARVGAPAPEFRDLLADGVLASARHPHDPMELAFHDLAAAWDLDPTAGAELVHEWGLSDRLLAVTRVWRRPGAGRLAAAKGAPEAIAELCALDPTARTALLAEVATMAEAGLRVLAVAAAPLDERALPATPLGLPFGLAGLVGLADPLRPSVPAAVAACRSAGVRVVMISGDHPTTARAVAARAGLADGDALTGAELERLDDDALAARLDRIRVFARVRPEQKLRIVRAYAARGEVVAMTGDGVNDAPSLKAAHVGIAMGERGTDVAREAASLVLLDDDFGAIVAAVRLGRRIWDNLQKAMAFVVAVHVPIAGLALLPFVFDLPILLGPVHIAFLEMVIDPVCSIAFEAEPEEDDVMARPPRDPATPLLSRRLIAWGAIQGVVALALVAAVELGAVARGLPVAEVRALTFFALVFALIGLVFVGRTFGATGFGLLRRPNPTLALVLATVVSVLAVSLLWPWASALLRFGPLHADDIAVTVAAGMATILVLEIVKAVAHRLERSAGPRGTALPPA